MKHFRWLTALVVGAFLLSAGFVLANSHENTVAWTSGQGVDSEDCTKVGDGPRTEDGWLHFVLTGNNRRVTAARLELSGTGTGVYYPEEDLPTNGSLQFFTPYYELDGLVAIVYYTGTTSGQLVLSDYCPGEEKSIEVTKTATAEFDRTHLWDITKKVETEEGDFEDGFPKIWLNGPSMYEETATWTVDVTYEGYEDGNFVVYGAIEIENVSAAMTPKTVTSIVDDLGLFGYDDIELACTDGAGASFDPAFDLPKEIAYGEIWTCTYSETLDGAKAGDSGTNEVVVLVQGETTPYGDTDGWSFDVPKNVINKTVNVEDISDLPEFGTQNLGSVTAPDDAQFTYTKDFAWADYKEFCGGGFAYGNTATIVETAQFASATLKVNVRCEELDVSKTVVTYFERTHEWDIAKKVETENGETLDGYPKIWLDGPGVEGDETATWTVDVTYEGVVDSGFKVSGEIRIENTGTLPAVIMSIVDELAGDAIAVDCPGFTDGDTLAVGGILTCTYSEVVDSKLEGSNVVTVTTGRDSYSDTKPIVWGEEPDEEFFATVNIKDVSDLFADKDWSVTAPDDAQFTYSKDFAWADYGADDCGGFMYENTATIVETGQSAEATLKVNVQCYIYESAWAKGDDAYSFCDNGFNNWGWSNLIEPDYYSNPSWDLWAGAAQCDTSKGTLVGSVTVVYDADGYVTVTYKLFPGFELEETHVYAGYDMFPTARNGRTTVAPGQYTNDGPFEGSVYVIAHAVVGMPDPNFGP